MATENKGSGTPQTEIAQVVEIKPANAYENSEILTALFRFQGEAPNIPKTALNKYADYKYAPLDSALDTIRPLLQKYGLMYRQGFAYDFSEDGKELWRTFLVTTIHHIPSGQRLKDELQLPGLEGGKMNNIQSMGASITYTRKYSLMVALGLVAEEDVDGRTDTKQTAQNANKPQNNTSNKPVQNQTTATTTKPVDTRTSQEKTNEGLKFFRAYQVKIAGIKNLSELQDLRSRFEEYIKKPDCAFVGVQIPRLKEEFDAKLKLLTPITDSDVSVGNEFADLDSTEIVEEMFNPELDESFDKAISKD